MELLAPAGGFDQLRAAIDFGADAVYLSANRFGMRARASNFSMENLSLAVDIAHKANCKVYVTCNVLIMQHDLSDLPEYFKQIDATGADALIIGDLGAFELAKKYAPHCDLHVSTQASVANAETAKVWHSLGAKRVVCAREMSLADIAAMRAQIPEDLEIETFVHGAQCMAVSGRCLISSYLTGRSGNQGHCTQPCRWSYTLEEEKRPDVHFPVFEDDTGSFIMNAKDLCMVSHIRDLMEAGVNSIKIEGRNKKAFYVATVVGAYRRAIDFENLHATKNENVNVNDEDSEANSARNKASEDNSADSNASNKANKSNHEDDDLAASRDVLNKELEEELKAISHRPYGTGFYFGDAEQADDFDGYEQECVHVADVIDCKKSCASDSDGSFRITLRCRNRFAEGDEIEVMSPGKSTRSFCLGKIDWVVDFDDEMPTHTLQNVDVANRSCAIYEVDCPFEVFPGSFVRIRTYRRSARHV